MKKAREEKEVKGKLLYLDLFGRTCRCASCDKRLGIEIPKINGDYYMKHDCDTDSVIYIEKIPQ